MHTHSQLCHGAYGAISVWRMVLRAICAIFTASFRIPIGLHMGILVGHAVPIDSDRLPVIRSYNMDKIYSGK